MNVKVKVKCEFPLCFGNYHAMKPRPVLN